MERAVALSRFAGARVARLATVAPDGLPRIVPCCFALDGDTIYSAVDDVKRKTTTALARVADVEARGVAALLVDQYDDNWDRLWWVRARGRAGTVDDPGERRHALSLLAAKYRQYREHPPPGAAIAVEVSEWRWWSAET